MKSKVLLLFCCIASCLACSNDEDVDPVVTTPTAEFRFSVRASNSENSDSYSNVGIIHTDLSKIMSPNSLLTTSTVGNIIVVEGSGLLEKYGNESSLPSVANYTFVIKADKITSTIQSAIVVVVADNFTATHDISSVLQFSENKIFTKENFISSNLFIRCEIRI